MSEPNEVGRPVTAQRLTWEQFEAGMPCLACGRVWDDRGCELDPEVEAAFAAAHAGGGRHTLAGSETVHCLSCCPPPPLSPAQIDQLVLLLRGG